MLLPESRFELGDVSFSPSVDSGLTSVLFVSEAGDVQSCG